MVFRNRQFRNRMIFMGSTGCRFDGYRCDEVTGGNGLIDDDQMAEEV